MGKQELTIKGAENVCNLSAVESLKNAALRSETLAFVKTLVEEQTLAENTKTAVDALRKKQAPIIYRIQSTKLYAKDGYKNMSEYAAAIGLSDASKSLISGLYAAGKVLSDKTAPDALKSMETSKLAQMGTLIRDESGYEQVKKDAESGALNGMTLADVKTYTTATKDALNTKPRPVTTYKALFDGDTMTEERYTSADGDMEEVETIDTLDGWKDRLAALGYEVIKLPADKHGNGDKPRFVLVDGSRAHLVYLFNTKPDKPKNSPTKTTTDKEEFLARAAAEGMPEDAIKMALRAMGWDK